MSIFDTFVAPDDRMTQADDSGDGVTSSLSDLASVLIGGVTQVAGDAISRQRSSNTAPVPDLASKAATPGAMKPINLAGASIPVVLIGGALIAFILLKGKF